MITMNSSETEILPTEMV